MFDFLEKSPSEELLKWLKNQKEERFTIYEILNAEIDFNTEQKRRSIWRLIDDDKIDLTNDFKIILKNN